MKALGWVTAFVVVITTSTILNGYALSVLWAWFIVKTFGLPTLTIPTAIGLSMIVSYLTYQPRESKGDSFASILGKGIAMAIAKPALALATAWVVVQFV